MLRAPLLVTRHFRRRAVRARFAPSAGRPCSRGPGELSAATPLHARIRQRRQTTARPRHAACDSALSRNSALPHERIAGRPLSRLRYLPRRCHFDPEMVDGPKKKHAKMPLRPRNGQKGRWASVHFGVEVASTDHLLETESREQPPGYRTSAVKAPCATNDPSPTNRGDRSLLHRIATENLNLAQLLSRRHRGCLNVDIMH